MKSIFTKLSTLLLCGAVAMVSCTDFSEDIQNLDNKVNNLGNTTQTELASLQKAITDLEAKLSAQYATKDEVAALKTTLENSIASEVAALSEDIAEVSAALNTAKSEINAAIAGLDSKKADKADVDAAVETATKAIAALQAELEAAKGDLEAEIASVKAEIAAAQEELESKIDGVDAKANELQNTLLSLGEYLDTLEAKVNEINNTLLSLAEYLPTVEAKVAELKNTLDSLSDHLAEREPVVDAKLAELQATLISLSNHLEEYEAVTDFKLVELQGSLAALSTYLEEYEASVDAKFNEILNTFESLSLFLDEKFAALEATDTDLYKEIDGLREAFTTINNLLADEVAAREAEDAAIYELLYSSVTALNNLIADLQAEDEAIYAEMENVRTYVAQVYNALSTEIAAANAALQAHIAAFEAYKEVVDAKLAGLEAEDGAIYELIGTTATALNNLIADLQAEDEAIYLEINGVRESLTQTMNYLLAEDEALKAEFQEKVDEIYAEIEGVRTNIAQVYNSLMAEVAELTNQILANATAIAALEDAVEMLTDWALAHQGEYNDLVQLVTKHVADLTAQIEALQEEDGAIYELIGETATALNNLIADANARMDEIEGVIEQNYNTTGAAIGALSNLINDIQADLNDRVSANEEAIKKLFERVQSLVYVPDYSDHKATIEYAVISQYEMENDRPAEAYAEGEDGKQLPYTYVAKASDLKYLVKADNAAEVAEAIEKNWASVLDYEVKDVKTTRAASETGADLEIVNVDAQGEYIIVSVVAKNFDAKFFEKKKIGGIYSAALVLADNNNTRTTEYTNLVPGTPVNYVARVLDGEDEDITFRSYEDAPVAYLPYDRDPAERIILEGHRLAFFAGEEINTADQLIAAGYDIQLERRVYQKQLNTEVWQDHLITLKKGEVELRQVGPFELREDPLASITKENDTYVKIREEMSKETYKALKAEGQHVLTIDYRYNVNGLNVNTEASVEICNRLVEVNFETIVPWTLETALSTIADSKMYEGPVVTTFKYDLAKAANKPLEGYSLYSIIHAADKPVYVPKCPISLSINDETITATLKHGQAARYSFPENNNDDVVDYNSYTYSRKADFDDLTVTVNVTLKLGEQAPHQYLKKDVKFTTEAGANGWLFGYWNALEDAYQKFLADGYIGYVDAPETGKAKFFEAFAQTSSYGNMGAMPVVNGKTGIKQNVNIPFTANNNEAGEHKFQLWHEQLGLTPEQPYVDGTKHTILQSVKPYFMIPFTFTVNGTVDLPDYALDLDPVRVVNNIVDVYGEISPVTKQYTVDVSDLSKYYYVVNKEGTKSLVNVNNDVVTVDFSLSPMKGVEETGFNFNGVADQTEATLAVDFAKSEPYILPSTDEAKAIVEWGTYPHTEVGVNAVLKVNGFPVVAKPITLVTKDPLDITFENVNVTLNQKNGTNAEPTVAKIYSNFTLTSAAEPNVENLFNTEAWTLAGLFKNSNANHTYGVEVKAEFLRVYFINERGKAEEWDQSKITLGKITADQAATYSHVKEGDFDGTISIKADDGNVKTPIYVDVAVKMTHRIHADGGPCNTEGIVTVKFIPEGYEE